VFREVKLDQRELEYPGEKPVSCLYFATNLRLFEVIWGGLVDSRGPAQIKNEH